MTPTRCAIVLSLKREVDALRGRVLEQRDKEESGRGSEDCAVSEAAMDHLTEASRALIIAADQLDRARTCR